MSEIISKSFSKKISWIRSFLLIRKFWSMTDIRDSFCVVASWNVSFVVIVIIVIDSSTAVFIRRLGYVNIYSSISRVCVYIIHIYESIFHIECSMEHGAISTIFQHVSHHDWNICNSHTPFIIHFSSQIFNNFFLFFFIWLVLQSFSRARIDHVSVSTHKYSKYCMHITHRLYASPLIRLHFVMYLGIYSLKRV